MERAIEAAEARVQQLQRQLGSAQGKLQSAEEQLSEARAEGRHLSSQLQAERSRDLRELEAQGQCFRVVAVRGVGAVARR